MLNRILVKSIDKRAQCHSHFEYFDADNGITQDMVSYVKKRVKEGRDPLVDLTFGPTIRGKDFISYYEDGSLNKILCKNFINSQNIKIGVHWGEWRQWLENGTPPYRNDSMLKSIKWLVKHCGLDLKELDAIYAKAQKKKTKEKHPYTNYRQINKAFVPSSAKDKKAIAVIRHILESTPDDDTESINALTYTILRLGGDPSLHPDNRPSVKIGGNGYESDIRA